jgi:hypothetical protein
MTMRPAERATKHPGSKRGVKSRLTARAQAELMSRPAFVSAAKARSGYLDPGQADTSPQLRERLPQRCLPPHARHDRQPLEPARPLNAAEREARYLRQRYPQLAQVSDARMQQVLMHMETDNELLPAISGAQKRRLNRKLGHSLRAARGIQPQPVTVPPLRKTPKGTSQPLSHQMSRGFLRMLGRLRRADRYRAVGAWQRRDSRR